MPTTNGPQQEPQSPGALPLADGANFLRVALGDWDSDPPTEQIEGILKNPFAINPGDEIGRYRLIKSLGEGGFGLVWQAEQTTPINRQVALKIIRVGMNTEQVVARFHAERQVLALMDHPGIASVFDAGSTANERPYFVMELVNGPPITTFCNQHRLPLAERLRLFVEVCRAVQHAHQKGVLHRDLKPSHILISETDGKPTPKIIDFGIAKAVDSIGWYRDIEQTRHDVLLGTPTYMSPEQTILGNPDLDTRTDIYSLGVILYEVLTGLLPVAAASAPTSSLQEVLRAVQIDAPVRPSTRVLSAVDHPSHCQLTTPVELSRRLAGDLDWITLKALEKDRRNRYNSADALAADLINHLEDLPITAGRPSVTAATLKFIRRNRLLVASSAAILLALMIGVTVATYGLVREKSMRTLAESLRQIANEQQALAETEKHKAKEQRDLALVSEQTAQNERENAEATLGFLTQLLERTGENVKQGKNPEALRLALDSLTTEISTFSTNPEVIEAIIGRTALIYRFLREEKKSLALVADQLQMLEKTRSPSDNDLLAARELYARTLYLQGQVQDSYAQYDEVVNQRERLIDTRDGPRKLFLVRRNRADVWAGSGRRKESLAEYEDILATATQEIHDHSSWPVFMRGYAQTLTDAKRWAEAAKIYDETLRDLDLANADGQHMASTIHLNRSRLFVKLNDLSAATASLERAIQLQRKARGNSSPWLSEWFVELSRLYHVRHRYDDAVKAASTAVETALAIGQTDRLHLCHRAHADQLEASGNHDAAAISYRASSELARQHVPPPVSAWLDLAHSVRNVALCSRFGEAASLARRLSQIMPSWRGDTERSEDLRLLESTIAFTHLSSSEFRSLPFNPKFIQIGRELANPIIDRFIRNYRKSKNPAIQQAIQLLDLQNPPHLTNIVFAADFLALEQILYDRWSGGDDAARLLELAAALRIACHHEEAVEAYRLAATIENTDLIIPNRRHSAHVLAAETLRLIGKEAEAAPLITALATNHHSGKDPITDPLLLKKLVAWTSPAPIKTPQPAPAQTPSPLPRELAKDGVSKVSP